jgi:hypothetical protein
MYHVTGIATKSTDVMGEQPSITIELELKGVAASTGTTSQDIDKILSTMFNALRSVDMLQRSPFDTKR